MRFKRFIFGQKNPNGGISWRELVSLENEIFDLSKKLNVKPKS